MFWSIFTTIQIEWKWWLASARGLPYILSNWFFSPSCSHLPPLPLGTGPCANLSFSYDTMVEIAWCLPSRGAVVKVSTHRQGTGLSKAYRDKEVGALLTDFLFLLPTLIFSPQVAILRISHQLSCTLRHHIVPFSLPSSHIPNLRAQ